MTIRIKTVSSVAFLVAVAALAVYLLVKQHVTGEEARIRKLIGDMQQAFENKKLSKCLAVVADNYSDNFGHGSKEELETDLRALFHPAHELHVRIEDPDIRVEGDRATVALTVTGTANTILGDFRFQDVVKYTRFELLLRKERGRWKVYRAVGIDTSGD